MRRNETLIHLARVMENCNMQDLDCERIFVHCCLCMSELADDAIGMVERLLVKPAIRSCRIPLVIDFDRMTDVDYWLNSKIFSVPRPPIIEPLKLKIVTLANMLRELQIKILQADVDYAEQFFKRMAARLEKSTHTLDYELWRIRHPHPTMAQLEHQQIQLTANILIAGVLAYDEEPTGDEIAAVRLDLSFFTLF